MIAGTQVEYQSDAGSTKDTPYLTLTGEVWDVFCVFFLENWLRFNGTALYFSAQSVESRTTWSELT